MEQELVTKIETADIPAELKNALTDLGQNLGALLPLVSLPLKRRVPYWFGKVIAEATDPTTETHWWETAFDFIRQAARENNPLGQPVLTSVEKLSPLLRAHLGADERVTLREITADTVFGICLLSDTLTAPKNFLSRRTRSRSRKRISTSMPGFARFTPVARRSAL